MTTLSNDDKLVIVDQKIKNLEYQKYSIQLDLQLENAVASPNASTVSNLNGNLTDLNAKIAILETEKASLEE